MPERALTEAEIPPPGHFSLRGYETALGVLIQEIDPNQFVTTWAHDGFGRLTLETRPAVTPAEIFLSRTGT